MALKLYEVVQWGNEDEGANGTDTIMLVRAESVGNAAAFGERAGLKVAVIYELGEDSGIGTSTGELIPPVRRTAINFGWVSWWPKPDSDIYDSANWTRDVVQHQDDQPSKTD